MPTEGRMRLLVLGGTREARELADGLIVEGHSVVSSFAGVTENPILPASELRFGRFGGVDGLIEYMSTRRFDALIDATHPFAANIATNAAIAAERLELPHFRLERPPWTPEAGDRWTTVRTIGEAAAVIPSAARVLLTTGRRELAPFFARADLSGVARMIEAPEFAVPRSWRLLRARPPFSVADEQRLLADEKISVLVTKNSGGEDTRAKLLAGRERNVPVIMIARPAKPPVPTYDTIEALCAALGA